MLTRCRNFFDIFGNVRKVVGNLRKSLESRLRQDERLVLTLCERLVLTLWFVMVFSGVVSFSVFWFCNDKKSSFNAFLEGFRGNWIEFVLLILCQRTFCPDLWVSWHDKLSLMLKINVFSPQAWDSHIMQASKVQTSTYLLEPSRSNNNLCEPMEYSRFQVTGMHDQMGAKIKIQKIPVMWYVKC